MNTVNSWPDPEPNTAPQQSASTDDIEIHNTNFVPMEQETSIQDDMAALIEKMSAAKPNDRSETDRWYAIALTDMEKVQAYCWAFIFD